MTRIIVAAVVVSCSALAGPPLATITSAESFRIAGARVPVAGVPNWPLVDGDEVALSKAAGEVVFPDGTRLFLLPGSRFTVSVAGKRTLVNLTDGGVAYRFTKDSNVELAVLAEPVPPRSQQGRVMAVDGQAYWQPLMYLAAPPDQRRQGEPPVFGDTKLTPFNLDLANRWREYHPAFGNPPGENPPSGPLPPAEQVNPPELKPVSNWRP